MPPQAIIVFEDRPDAGFLLRPLQRGFRHCFCVVGGEQRWVICDPLKTRIEITLVEGLVGEEIAACYHAAGHAVLLGFVQPGSQRRSYRLRAMSCVEVVKHVLNVEAPHAFTPWQLHRALRRAHRYVPFLGGTTNSISSLTVPTDRNIFRDKQTRSSLSPVGGERSR
jgi:hypothetical protein